MTIPSGILRERKSALKRAKIVAITNCNLVNKDKLYDIRQEIFKITKSLPIEVSCKNAEIVNMGNNSKIEDLETFREDNYFVVMSAIGSPDNFVNTVINVGLKIKEEIIFSDHHKYQTQEIKEILNELKDNEYIVTTAKDAVKINEVVDMKAQRKIYVLNVSLNFRNGREIFEKEIKNLLDMNNEK
jgi:tetraacyldisaccharide 4'-kinase